MVAVSCGDLKEQVWCHNLCQLYNWTDVVMIHLVVSFGICKPSILLVIESDGNSL